MHQRHVLNFNMEKWGIEDFCIKSTDNNTPDLEWMIQFSNKGVISNGENQSLVNSVQRRNFLDFGFLFDEFFSRKHGDVVANVQNSKGKKLRKVENLW